jgi:hypothetical protein
MQYAQLIRFKSSAVDTLGLLCLNGKFLCFTLEDEYRDVKLKGETRIPAGDYPVGFHKSPKFTPRYGHDLLHVQNVPGFDFILLHPGNRETETDGCILVADTAHAIWDGGASELLNSKLAYDRIYPLLAAPILSGEGLTLSVIDSLF